VALWPRGASKAGLQDFSATAPLITVQPRDTSASEAIPKPPPSFPDRVETFLAITITPPF
jgi:hypothetical protein